MAVENIIFNQTNPVTKTVFVDINYYNIAYFDRPYLYFGKFKLKHISKQKYVAMT